jgi:lipid-A-disaccharide synthase
MVIVLVAGEASGDQLGAALIRAIRAREPEVRFAGIGGPLMKTEGCECWWDTSELSVMGLFEVVSHLPRLLKLRSQLIQRVLELRPDVFVGIDAPDFNLRVEKKLKTESIPVVHYVSPTIWAWRSGRVKTIARSTDKVMCLFPFEPDCYKQYPIGADYTGHPLADQIPLYVSNEPAREALDLETDSTCVALLPGSRMGEVERLSTVMLDAANSLSKLYPDICFLVPAATNSIRQYFQTALDHYPDVKCRLYSGRSREVIAAADVVVCASGTATLEVMLINRPMVVCYKIAGTTYKLMKWFNMLKTRFFSLPNILAGEMLVPELLQHEVTAQRIADETARWLEQSQLVVDLKRQFDELHKVLRIDAAATAGEVVIRHIKDHRS